VNDEGANGPARLVGSVDHKWRGDILSVGFKTPCRGRRAPVQGKGCVVAARSR
jgi:hypothetical protein